MTQYNTLSINLSYSQLNKLKSGIKNGTKVTLNLSSNLIRNCNGETNFPKLAFANGSSANIKFSKTPLSKMVQSREFHFSDFLDLIDPKIYGTGITLTVNEIKDIIKVIKS